MSSTSLGHHLHLQLQRVMFIIESVLSDVCPVVIDRHVVFTIEAVRVR